MNQTEYTHDSDSAEIVTSSFSDGNYRISIQYNSELRDTNSRTKGRFVPGIGSAKILMDETLDVERVWVTFSLSGLENCIIESNRKSYKIEVQQRPENWKVLQAYQEPGMSDWAAYTMLSSFIIPVVIDKGNWKPGERVHTFEVEIPKDIWEDRSLPFKLSWIDFYR